MKINNSSQYETIKLVAQKPQSREAKSNQVQMQEQKEVEQKPFVDLKTLNAQVAQVQGLEKTLGETKKKHEELLSVLEKGKSPELEKKIHNIELKITEMLKKSLTQSQELESLPSLYRSLLQSYDRKDYDKIEALLNQTQHKLHYLLDRFENEIAETFPQGAVEFDPKKVKNEFFVKSHNSSKLSSECLV